MHKQRKNRMEKNDKDSRNFLHIQIVKLIFEWFFS